MSPNTAIVRGIIAMTATDSNMQFTIRILLIFCPHIGLCGRSPHGSCGRNPYLRPFVWTMLLSLAEFRAFGAKQVPIRFSRRQCALEPIPYPTIYRAHQTSALRADVPTFC